jgi:hypothetical protein
VFFWARDASVWARNEYMMLASRDAMLYKRGTDVRFTDTGKPARVPRARDAWRKFTEIYGNSRGIAARTPCIDFLAAKCTVHVHP